MASEERTGQELHDKFDSYHERSVAAEMRAVPAFTRLLELAETADSGQIPRVARFLAGLYNGSAFPFDLYELRAVDVDISDDMLACLDAHRWARKDLHDLVPDGGRRAMLVIDKWGLKWRDNETCE